MNGNLPQHHYFYPVAYRPQLFPGLIGFLINMMVVIGLTSMMVVMIRKALAGEEVEPPFLGVKK